MAFSATGSIAEDGYDLWLRFRPIEDAPLRDEYRAAVTHLVAPKPSPTLTVAVAEARRGLSGLLGSAIAVENDIRRDGAVVVGTPASSPIVASLGWKARLATLGPEGYVIRSARIGGRRVTVVASEGDAGVLYGAYHFIRLLQTGQSLAALEIAERPRVQIRMLNHWDNLDGTIERGYAGRSLWKWDELPDRVDRRVEDYARANASLGINGAAINSVNANPRSLDADYLRKAAALANAFRPYGIRVFLSANFAAPKLLGDLATTDPLDPTVAKWWKDKADEIYQVIPDFGGFLVKANSEGQPGPQDYKRTHADGANVLADAVASHGGVVIWRAFVYDADVDADRVKRAYKEFVPLDGTFRENVFVQVKNGPLDFQPREPFHPLFGAMPKTPLMGELQVTQEYFGQSTHLVYLAPMWSEFLEADTHSKGAGSTVAKIIDGSIERYRRTGMAGVANTGDDRNWTGHDLAQANWYAYGRLAWNPDLRADAIAAEWIRMTWSASPDVVHAIKNILLESYDAYVGYTMPLGLHHLIGGDHYEPMPENDDPRRLDWSAIYYHRADAQGIGFDRTRKGSGGVDQYYAPMRDQWNDPKTTPESLLLWFHHLPWDYTLKSGKTLWDGLVDEYTRGAERAANLEKQWIALRGKVDSERFEAVAAKLRKQTTEAALWRDKCLRYFQQFSKRPATSSNAGEVALGLTFQGSYTQPKVKEPVYGGHASAMGPAPAMAPTDEVMPSPATFEEPTRLPARTFSGGATKDHILESTGNGVALIDYDNDGLLDLYLVTGAELSPNRERIPHRNVLFRNRGNWKFEDVSKRAGVDLAAWGQGVCAGDVDDDGRLDLYVTNWGPNFLLRNRGDGTFEEVAARAGVSAGGWSTGCAFLDADGDGDLDLYVVRYVDTTWDSVVRAERTLTWRSGPKIMVGPAGLKGEADLFFENTGAGRFVEAAAKHGLEDKAGAYGLGVVATDFDADGFVDLFVANDSNPNFLYRNKGDGTFESVGLLAGVAVNGEARAQAGMGVDAGDYDGDSRMDFVLTAFAHDRNTVYRNMDGEQFEDESEAAGLAGPTFARMGWGTAFVDADLDGKLDLFFANGHIFSDIEKYPQLGETYKQKNQLLLNVNGRFRDVSLGAGPGMQDARVGRGLAVGDLDNDGDPDVVINNMDDTPTLLENRQRTGHHWIAFRLTSPAKNRLAIGARVTIEAGGKQVREIRSGGSYLSQNDLRALFGLGGFSGPVSVEVRMPGGRRWQWRDLPSDRLHVLELQEQ